MVGNKGGLAARANYPWILIGLLWLVAFLNAADRNILLAVLPDLKAEFDLTDTQLALLGSVFFWIYAVGAFVAGRIGDSVRRSRLIIFGLVFWSVATGASSLATGFALLLAMRAMVAVGESTYYPTATALIGDWHKPQMRSRALSLHQTAVFAGSGLGAVAAGYIADAFSWHAPFLIFGGIGLIYVAVLWFFLYDAPIVHTAAEQGKPAEPIGIVLRIPAALILCAVFALATGASTGVTFWAPYFVKNLLGLNLAESAWVGAATINIAGFCAVPLGGL
ncbi:MAG: MFS transporter, partial [Sphingopyxis terrae]